MSNLARKLNVSENVGIFILAMSNGISNPCYIWHNCFVLRAPSKGNIETKIGTATL